MAFYRNQTPTMDQIKMMGNMRITTPAEATAFLRTLPKILEQVSYVTQRIGLGEQHQANREAMEKIERAVEETPAPIAPEPKEFVPADLALADHHDGVVRFGTAARHAEHRHEQSQNKRYVFFHIGFSVQK